MSLLTCMLRRVSARPASRSLPAPRAAVALQAASLALAAALLSGCWKSDDRLAGGDATETGNAIAGRILIGGQDAAGARVTLLPSEYNPIRDGALPDSLTLTVDRNGAFKFKGVKAGQYNIEGFDARTGRRLLLAGLVPRADRQVNVIDSLRSTGSLSVPLPETGDTGAAYVFVPGSTFQTRVDAAMRRAGRVVIDSLPEGRIPTLIYTRGDSLAPLVPVASDVKVDGGVTSTVPPYFWWAHRARLVLNTASTTIAATVRGFPLLVRLEAPGFDFSQALGNGSDLRFTDAAGATLDYEIESWDSAAGRAAVWVRVDSIVPGSDSQYVTMHWGSSQAASAGAPVFSPANGFASVWHMNQEASDTTAQGLYKDATRGGTDGNDRIGSADRGGAIGFGHGFLEGDYVQAAPASERLRLVNAFTLSVWFKAAATASDSGADMATVGDNYGLRLTRTGGLHLWYWPVGSVTGANSGWNFADVKATSYFDGAWHLAAGVFDGAALHIYVDGAEQATKAVTGPVTFNYPLNLTSGRHGYAKPFFNFVGNLDEIEVHSEARGADWIKLSYENQKPGSVFPQRTEAP